MKHLVLRPILENLTAGVWRPGSFTPSWGTLRGHPSSKLPEEPVEAFVETVPHPTFCPHPAFSLPQGSLGTQAPTHLSISRPPWISLPRDQDLPSLRSLGTQAPTRLSISRPPFQGFKLQAKEKQNKQKAKSTLEVETQENPRAFGCDCEIQLCV